MHTYRPGSRNEDIKGSHIDQTAVPPCRTVVSSSLSLSLCPSLYTYVYLFHSHCRLLSLFHPSAACTPRVHSCNPTTTVGPSSLDNKIALASSFPCRPSTASSSFYSFTMKPLPRKRNQDYSRPIASSPTVTSPPAWTRSADTEKFYFHYTRNRVLAVDSSSRVLVC